MRQAQAKVLAAPRPTPTPADDSDAHRQYVWHDGKFVCTLKETATLLKSKVFAKIKSALGLFTGEEEKKNIELGSLYFPLRRLFKDERALHSFKMINSSGDNAEVQKFFDQTLIFVNTLNVPTRSYPTLDARRTQLAEAVASSPDAIREYLPEADEHIQSEFHRLMSLAWEEMHRMRGDINVLSNRSSVHDQQIRNLAEGLEGLQERMADVEQAAKQAAVSEALTKDALERLNARHDAQAAFSKQVDRNLNEVQTVNLRELSELRDTLTEQSLDNASRAIGMMQDVKGKTNLLMRLIVGNKDEFDKEREATNLLQVVTAETLRQYGESLREIGATAASAAATADEAKAAAEEVARQLRLVQSEQTVIKEKLEVITPRTVNAERVLQVVAKNHEHLEENLKALRNDLAWQDDKRMHDVTNLKRASRRELQREVRERQEAISVLMDKVELLNGSHQQRDETLQQLQMGEQQGCDRVVALSETAELTAPHFPLVESWNELMAQSDDLFARIDKNEPIELEVAGEDATQQIARADASMELEITACNAEFRQGEALVQNMQAISEAFDKTTEAERANAELRRRGLMKKNEARRSFSGKENAQIDTLMTSHERRQRTWARKRRTGALGSRESAGPSAHAATPQLRSWADRSSSSPLSFIRSSVGVASPD